MEEKLLEVGNTDGTRSPRAGSEYTNNSLKNKINAGVPITVDLTNLSLSTSKPPSLGFTFHDRYSTISVL